MNNDTKLSNLSEAEFRNLQEAPLEKTDAAAPQTNQDLLETLDNSLAEDIDDTIAQADLDRDIIISQTLDAMPEDEDDVPAGGFREVLESDLGEELTDGGVSHNHIHSSDMIASDTPGQIDIEDMDERDLEGTGIPADALLDPLED